MERGFASKVWGEFRRVMGMEASEAPRSQVGLEQSGEFSETKTCILGREVSGETLGREDLKHQVISCNSVGKEPFLHLFRVTCCKLEFLGTTPESSTWESTYLTVFRVIPK